MGESSEETSKKEGAVLSATQETVAYRNQTLIKLTVGIAILGIGWFLYWFFYLQYHEYTDDAYAGGNMVNINSAVSGSVAAFYADDTDYVSEGQLLVVLDDTEHRLVYEKELAALAEIVLQVRQLYDNVAVAETGVAARVVALEKARYDYENRHKLVTSGAVSAENYTHARDDMLIAEAGLRQAEMQLKVAADAAGNSPPSQHPYIIKQKALVRNAYYNFQRCAIYAPVAGYVAKRAVEVGQWVTPMTDLMAIIPTDNVWVEANFKETQLAYMRVGQPATVTFDMYGSGAEFKGKVVGIASGTGSVFSIIPPQNATGNWIKIVQRLPVRISLDPEMLKEYPPRLGISAEVDVDLTDQNLPYLAPPVPVRTVGETPVFRIDFQPVEVLMDAIIDANMDDKEL